MICLGINHSIKSNLHQRKKPWRYNERPSKKTELVATLMDWDQSQLLLLQPHNLNPDRYTPHVWLLWKNELDLGIYGQLIYSTCLGRALRGRDGGGGEISPLPTHGALFPLGWEVQSPRHFKGAWCKTSWPTTWPIHGEEEISFLTSGIFPLQLWDSIPHQSPAHSQTPKCR